jgi:hypothetical protein
MPRTNMMSHRDPQPSSLDLPIFFNPLACNRAIVVE